MGLRSLIGVVLTMPLFLAGCERSEQPASSREMVLVDVPYLSASDPIVVWQTCGPIDGREYRSLGYGIFRMHPESVGTYAVNVGKTHPKVVVTHISFDTANPCKYIIEFLRPLPMDEGEVVVKAIPESDRRLNRDELAAFNSRVQHCEDKGEFSKNAYENQSTNALTVPEINLPYDTFIGCPLLIKNFTQGFIIEYGGIQYRVISITDTILITRI